MKNKEKRVKILTQESEITQEAMKAFLTLKKEKEQIEAQIAELEVHLIEALQNKCQPSKGLFTCKMGWTSPRTIVKWKEEACKRMTEAEIDCLLETTPKTKPQPKLIIEIATPEKSVEFINGTK